MTNAVDLLLHWPLAQGVRSAQQLLAAYSAASRGYHDQQHLGEVLAALTELDRSGERFDIVAVNLAAWFHDAVYRGRDDDEEQSALWCESELSELHLESSLVSEVARLVRLTKNHDPAESDRNGAALADADLAILAAPTERYRDYVAGVRSDYLHVPDADFRRGRAEVLRSLVAAQHLFTTGYGRSVWEARARANVADELKLLET